MDTQNHTYFTSQDNSSVPDTFAKSSRILGFLAVGTGIASALIPLFAPLPLMFGLLSVVFGIVSRKQTGRFHNYAVTGLVCSGVTLVFLLVVAIFLIAFFNSAGGQQIIAEYLEQYRQLLEAYSEFYGE